MRRRQLTTLALSAALVVVLAACGDADDDSGSSVRTVEVEMSDIAFEPTELEVSRGETIRFEFTNRGELPHDAFIGDESAQDEHGADMAEAAGDDEHEGGHGEDDADALTLEPGERGELEHTFDEAGSFQVGCHQPGHYEAGMIIDITVA